MRLRRLLDDEAFARVRAAVTAAERGISGEIVPVVVESSDGYEEAYWRAGSLFAVAALGAELLYQQLGPYWFELSPVPAAALLLLAAACGAALVARLPAFRRAFAGSERMAERVAARARSAFLAEQVFATRERTGVLIFVSLLEQRVEVLADSGIHARALPGSWDRVAAAVVNGVKAGRPGDGLCEAIRLCGDALRDAGFVARPDDVNELRDEPRLEGRP